MVTASAEMLEGEFAGAWALRLPAHDPILYRMQAATTPCRCL